jgi:hypothetical protein
MGTEVVTNLIPSRPVGGTKRPSASCRNRERSVTDDVTLKASGLQEAYEARKIPVNTSGVAIPPGGADHHLHVRTGVDDAIEAPDEFRVKPEKATYTVSGPIVIQYPIDV